LGIQVPTQEPAGMMSPVTWLESFNWAVIGSKFWRSIS
jgi:hypothetical protein